MCQTHPGIAVASLNDYIRLVRPHQFVKNLFVFLPSFFGHRLGDPAALWTACLAFAGFCLAGGAVYVFNDLRDVEDDRKHPSKKDRPIASGQVTPGEAVRLIMILLTGALAVALVVADWRYLAVLFSYLGLNVAYSLGLKHKAIVDVSCIAVGFVLRIFAGAIAVEVRPSQWIVLMTFLLALFLALAKRRDDLVLSQEGQRMRKALDGYNLEMVSSAMNLMAAVTIVSYIMYTVSPEVAAYYGSRQLYLTTIWVILGILRYLQVTYVRLKSGSPTKVLLQDRFMQLVVLAWLATFFLVIYVFGT